MDMGIPTEVLGEGLDADHGTGLITGRSLL
jgi:hypothetical protein